MAKKREIEAFEKFLIAAKKYLDTRESEYKMLCKGYGKERADAMIEAWYYLATKNKGRGGKK